MFHKLLVAALAGSWLVVSSVQAQPQSIESYYVQQELRQIDLMGNWLQLTPAQQGKVQDILKQALERIKALPKPNPLPLVEQPTFNRSTAANISKQREQWHTEIDIAILEALHQAYQLLDAGQKDKFKQALQWHAGTLPHNQKEVDTLPFMKRSGG